MPTTQEIADFYKANANNPDAIRQAMSQYGINADQAAAATGVGADNFRFNNFGGKNFSTQQVKDFYAKGGDDNRFAQELGITDPWQRREALLQARSIGGAPSGDAAVQHQFNLYKQYNPNGKYANDFAGWSNDQGLHTLDAMRSGTFTGAASSPIDWTPGGVYGPGTGHDFSFQQSRYGTGAHGTGDAWVPWSGASGENNTNAQSAPSGYAGRTPIYEEQWFKNIRDPATNLLNGAGPLSLVERPIVQPGQTTGTTPSAPNAFDWRAPQPTQFNTPILDALYNAQQQRMTMPAPQFNFQSKPGALTQAIEAN